MADYIAVAVLGTGVMGMEVRVWNRTREKAEPLAEDGAKVVTRFGRDG